MDAVFAAVSDTTRRTMLDQLRERGPLNVLQLTAGLPISRQAVTKHLDLLVAAGLVRVTRAGRERLHEIDPRPLEAVDDWLTPYAHAWDRRLEALRAHLGEPDEESGHDQHD